MKIENRAGRAAFVGMLLFLGTSYARANTSVNKVPLGAKAAVPLVQPATPLSPAAGSALVVPAPLVMPETPTPLPEPAAFTADAVAHAANSIPAANSIGTENTALPDPAAASYKLGSAGNIVRGALKSDAFQQKVGHDFVLVDHGIPEKTRAALLTKRDVEWKPAKTAAFGGYAALLFAAAPAGLPEAAGLFGAVLGLSVGLAIALVSIAHPPADRPLTYGAVLLTGAKYAFFALLGATMFGFLAAIAASFF